MAEIEFEPIAVDFRVFIEWDFILSLNLESRKVGCFVFLLSMLSESNFI